MNEAWEVARDYWGLAIVALLVVIGWAVYDWLGRWLGNAGSPGQCVICRKPASKYLPAVGREIADHVFERVRRLKGIPWSYKVTHDYTDARRLCRFHYQKERLKLERAFDRARSRHAEFNTVVLDELLAFEVGDDVLFELRKDGKADSEDTGEQRMSSLDIEPVEGALE